MAECGAKTRAGTPCKRMARANGRCNLHGGKSTGPPSGNKNALKYGIYSNAIDSEEKELWTSVKIDTLEDEIKILKLRFMRAVKAGNSEMIDKLSGRIATMTKTNKELGGETLDDETKRLMRVIGEKMV